MIVHIIPGGGVAAYEQIRSQISAHAASGALTAGTRLPSIRQLAGDLAVAPGTVARAYRELEREGVVVTRVGRGTTIAPTQTCTPAVTDPAESTRQRMLQQAAASYAATVRRLGATRDEAVAALDDDLATTSHGRAVEVPTNQTGALLLRAEQMVRTSTQRPPGPVGGRTAPAPP